MRRLWAALVAAIGMHVAHADWTAHFEARLGMLPLYTATAGTGQTVLVGDSNTEAFWWSMVAGCRIINAGMGGATVHDVAQRASLIAAITRPRIVHVMVGTNDMLSADVPDIVASAEQIIKAFRAVGALVVLWPVPPTAMPFSDRTDRRDGINDALLAAANSLGAFWDWWWPLQGVPLQADGVHFSAQAQASRYYRIETWQRYLLGPC